MPTLLFGTILPWLLVALVGWLFYQVLRQNGRILRPLDALEEQVGRSNPGAGGGGLEVGTTAPPFELPDLLGKLARLSDWQGRRLLLIFFDPQCGFCKRMAPRLAALKVDGSDGRPLPVVITTGSREENRRFMDEHAIHCPVLLESSTGEVASRYQAHGTPTGYLIDEDGTIATPSIVGADALLALADVPAPVAKDSPAEVESQSAATKGKANRGLHTSRLRRDGLKAGETAPVFTLPKLDGGELSLADYRGRKVLLVFSDPHCGPCNALAPTLEQFHREVPGVQLMMISRRDAEANRTKVAELGLTFPVALQKSWEISLQYGMFATPIAYLIDEQGVLATDVLEGAVPIKEVIAVLRQPARQLPEGNGVYAETAS